MSSFLSAKVIFRKKFCTSVRLDSRLFLCQSVFLCWSGFDHDTCQMCDRSRDSQSWFGKEEEGNGEKGRGGGQHSREIVRWAAKRLKQTGSCARRCQHKTLDEYICGKLTFFTSGIPHFCFRSMFRFNGF